MIIYTILFLTIYSLIEKSFTMNKIYWYSGFLLIALIFKSYFGGWAMVKMQKTGSTASKDLRIAMGDHVKKLNLGYFNSHNLGYLINILTMDITDFEQAITHNIPDLLKGDVVANDNIEYIKARNIKISSDSELESDVDGDKSDNLPVEIKVLAQRVEVFSKPKEE